MHVLKHPFLSLSLSLSLSCILMDLAHFMWILLEQLALLRIGKYWNPF